jgi:exosortase
MSGWLRFRLPIVFGLVALGMAPLTAVYFRNLWAQPHYQFFPVLLSAVALLLASRWKAGAVVPAAPDDDDEDYETAPAIRQKLWSQVRPLVSLGIAGLGLAIEYASITAFPAITPWGGYLGLLVAGFGLVMYVGQGRPVSLVPAWALMALILMPPENGDDQLITYLQQRTASFTSQCLDLLGVDHIREGVLIEIESRKLFVEEACSGVQSLFSLLAVAAVLAVYYSRSLVHTLLLIGAAVAGAGAVNVLRTVTIVFALDKVGIDLLSEPQHTVLGIVVFVVAMAWLVCCDAFLTFMTRPIDVPDRQILENVWVWLWNRVIAGLRWRGDPTPAVRRGVVMNLLCGVCLFGLAVGGGALAIASTKAVLASQKPGANPLVAPVHEGKVIGTLGSLTEDDLPADFDGWKRVTFEDIKRSESNALGEHSKAWGYLTPFGRATVSIDYPFRGWHDLRVCYQGAGWFASETETSSTDGGHGVIDVTQFSLQKTSGESAIVFFAALNEDLQPIPTREGSGATQTFVRRVQKAIQATDNMDVIAQYQILVQSPRPLRPEELDEVSRRLSFVKSRIIEHIQAHREEAP